jgi:hypothetical protein
MLQHTRLIPRPNSTLLPSSARRLRIPIGCLVAVLSLLILTGGRAMGETSYPPPWPGLPSLPCVLSHTSPAGYQAGCIEYPAEWGGAAQAGVAGSGRAQQWTRIPLTILATHVAVGYSWLDPSPDPPNPGKSHAPFDIWAWMVSPDGSAHNYGDSPLIRVRTVAFGAVPVEAALQVSQRRDAHGLPKPLHAYQDSGSLNHLDPRVAGQDRAYVDPAQFDSPVTLVVKSLKVDGIDARLRDGCSTGTPARLQLTSPALVGNPASSSSRGTFDQAKGFAGTLGGTLTGNLAIPAFGSCRTASGEDLGRLLTAAISGPDNPVTVRLGTYSCFDVDLTTYMLIPPAPGENTPEKAHCYEWFPDDDPYPNHRPKIRIVPDPLEIPTTAP